MTTISTAPPPSITSPTNESTTISDATPYVGILALEVYTPRTYLRQSDLETHMGVPSGKFTIGLGQEGLAVTGDVEDINSIALTVVHSLLDKYVRRLSFELGVDGVVIQTYTHCFAASFPIDTDTLLTDNPCPSQLVGWIRFSCFLSDRTHPRTQIPD